MKIKMKTMALAGLMGSALLLTGCGGGGTSAAPINDNQPPKSKLPPPGFCSPGAPLGACPPAPAVTSELTGGTGIASGYEHVDVNGDDYISRREARDAWDALSSAEKVTFKNEFASTSGFSVSEVNSAIHSDQYNFVVAQDVILAQLNGVDGSGVRTLVIDGFGSGVTHGHHVKGILDAIAPGADKRKIDLTDNQVAFDIDEMFTASGRSLIDGANVINMSFGAYGDDEVAVADMASFIDSEFDSGALFVVSAGNDGDIGQNCQSMVNCNYIAGGISVSEMSDQLIVVGAVNDTGDALDSHPGESSYVTQAGILKDFYLVAPVVPDSDGGRGTSYAAPVVSGVAALVMDNMNNTDAAIVRTRILTTADDIGAPGVDDVFGHGRLNVGRALAPVGGLR